MARVEVTLSQEPLAAQQHLGSGLLVCCVGSVSASRCSVLSQFAMLGALQSLFDLPDLFGSAAGWDAKHCGGRVAAGLRWRQGLWRPKGRQGKGWWRQACWASKCHCQPVPSDFGAGWQPSG
jgi:hypothetical protein